jgi:hypothetical protein
MYLLLDAECARIKISGEMVVGWVTERVATTARSRISILPSM